MSKRLGGIIGCKYYLSLACVFCYSCSFLFVVFCVFVFLFCSHRQPRILLGMVEARSVNVKKTTNTKLLLFLIFSLLVANPKKLFYTVASPARGLLNRKKRTK